MKLKYGNKETKQIRDLEREQRADFNKTKFDDYN